MLNVYTTKSLDSRENFEKKNFSIHLVTFNKYCDMNFSSFINFCCIHAYTTLVLIPCNNVYGYSRKV